LNPITRAVTLAAAVFLLPGVNWSFVTNYRTWKGLHGAFYSFSDPWFPDNFRPAVDQSAFTWSSAGAWWTFDPGSPAQGAFYRDEDGINLVDLTTLAEPYVPGETTVFKNPDDLSDIVEVDTALNQDFPFATSGEPSSYDVQTVAVHEFGHWLELLDSGDSSAVMYGHIDVGQVKRSLTTDDINGINSLYPSDGSGGGGGGGGCHAKIGGSNVSVSFGMRRRPMEIEASRTLASIQTFMLQQPKPRALLFAIVEDLPELEHIAANHEAEVSNAWEPIMPDWLPGLYWLGGDLGRGQNLVLTNQRAGFLIRGIDAIQAHSSAHLSRDLLRTKRFILKHIGWSLEEMKAELFEVAHTTSNNRTSSSHGD
jgi:hypothetical protein